MVEQVARPVSENPAGEKELTQEEMQALLAQNLATEECQKARYMALNGKRMLFIGGDFMYSAFGKMLQDELVKLRGFGVYIIGVFQTGKEDGKYFRDAKDGNCIDEAIFADIGSPNGAENIVNKVKEEGIDIQYAFSFHESTQPIMAAVQEMLGLPGNPLEAYEKARDKYATRKALQDAGLNSIRATQIWKVEDAATAASHVGFPMIVKPTVGMGSAGVYKANDEAQLFALVERLFDDMDRDWLLNRSKVGRQAPVIAEEFVIPEIYDGKINEFDIEVLMWDGEVKYTNVLDNWITTGKSFQEVGSLAPSLAPEYVCNELKEYAAKCVKALGFTRGGFHVECWYTKNGPLLIEVNARIGGGFTAGTHANVWGVSPFFEFAMSMLDVPINPPRSLTPKCAYGFILPNAEVSGRLADKLTYLEPAQESPFFVRSTYYFKGGETVKGNDKQVGDWIGEIHLINKEPNSLELAHDMERVIDRVHQAAANETTPPVLPQEE